MFKGMLSVLSGTMLLFAALPAGTTYKLQSYGMGSGGAANATSSAYAMEGISGEISGTRMSGTTYSMGSGFISAEQANVPAAPAFTNPSNYYNKLKLVIDSGGNPSDATFAVAISTDNFTTTQYVQSDLTVGATLGLEDYQLHSAWNGGGIGVNIIGLLPNTQYKVKVRAEAGKFTESAYSAVATASTVNPSLTFDLDVAATDVENAAPYNLSLDSLLPGAVTTGTNKIWVDFDTNGDSGGNVYMYGQNSGLYSAAVAYTIPAVSVNLFVSPSAGFGLRSATVAQSSGGPLSAVSPYNGAGDNVGLADTSIRKVYTSPAPIVAGRASLFLKARASSTTPAASDYSEVLTIIGSANF